MQETLMGADKEWIYSFSTWDYPLPGGTQLTSLCQQSAELAPYTRRQIASLCPLSPSASATSWLPSLSSAGHRTQTKSHSAGEITWSLTYYSFPLIILFFNVNVHCAFFNPKQNVCTVGCFCFFWRKKTNWHGSSPVLTRNLPPPITSHSQACVNTNICCSRAAHSVPLTWAALPAMPDVTHSPQT